MQRHSCDIDFDAASKSWRHNKRHMNNGYFVYKCIYVHSNGKRCYRTIETCKQIQRPIMAWEFEKQDNDTPSDEFCKQHRYRSSYGLTWQ